MHKKSYPEFQKEIDQAKQIIKPGDRYFHFRHPDKFYTIIAIEVFESDEEICIIYAPEDFPEVKWIRKLSNFTEEVEHEGQRVKRFQKIPS